MCVCVSACVHVHGCVSALCACVHMCVSACCVCACVYMCVHVCTSVHVCVGACVHTYMLRPAVNYGCHFSEYSPLFFF